MKVVATTVGRKGPDDEGRNEERLRAAKRALEKGTTLGADLIVLPGGFFTARSRSAREAVADSLISEAKRLGIAIVLGVDQEVKNLTEDYRREIQSGRLPFYAYAWSASENVVRSWPQRSTNNENQWWAPEKACREVRLLRIGNESVAVLMCGEIFNQRIRHALVNHQPRPNVVVDVAHIGSGFRVYQGMKVLARLGLPSLCSVHAQTEYAVKHCYIPPGKRMSSRLRDEYVYGLPHIELKLWTF